MSIDHLDVDPYIPVNQKFCCISFLSDLPPRIVNEDTKEEMPDPNYKLKSLKGIKIRGVFNTIEEANEHATKLRGADPYFNIFVGEVGKWLPFDPNPHSEQVEDVNYENNELNEIMRKYKENENKNVKEHEKRKNDMIMTNISENIQIKKNELMKEELKYSEIENINNQIKKLEEKLLEYSKKK